MSGLQIYNAAFAKRAVPYVLGGGACTGPTKGLVGTKKGFDVPGLAQFAVCSTTKIKVPHSIKGLYNHPRGKKIAYQQRKKGDLVFFGKDSRCSAGPTSVAIVRDPSTWLGYQKPRPKMTIGILPRQGTLHACPKVVRYW